MNRVEDPIERLLLFVAERASGRGIAIVMGILYGGVGLLLPIVAGANTLLFVALNFIGAMTAFLFGLVWFNQRVQQAHRRHLVEWTTNLRLLDAREFEWLVGEVFRRDGWKVDEVTSQSSPDGNIDLRMSRGKENAMTFQCKRWQSWHVGVDEIRKFGGTLMGERRATTSGYFVTLSEFTPQAATEGERLRDRVGRRRRAVQASRAAQTSRAVSNMWVTDGPRPISPWVVVPLHGSRMLRQAGPRLAAGSCGRAVDETVD